MDSKNFKLGLGFLSKTIPYAAKMTDDEIAFGWLSLDQRVKDEVSNDSWIYACNQRAQEQDPPKYALHLQILRHVYRCENGTPNFNWGLKPEIEDREAARKNAKALINSIEVLPPSEAHESSF